MHDLRNLQNVLSRWGMTPATLLPRTPLAGSPERALHRLVFRDTRGERFVLEQIDASRGDRKALIARRIHRLAARGVAATPYRRGTDGRWIQHVDGYCWQMAPYIEGVALDRTRYWDDAWRGRAMGRLLVHMAEESADWQMDEPPFDLPGYIDALMAQVPKHDPAWLPETAPIHQFVRRHLYPVLENIPMRFCHGDPHPLNVIWGENRINSLIDWEFCGWKPAIYDTALVVGCVGAEAPEARQAHFMAAFLDTLAQAEMLSPETMPLLPLFALAVRFAWLSEWLRKKDTEMIRFELFYMRLLMAEWSDVKGSRQSIIR